MCNLSDLIEEKGIERERENGIRILISVYQEGDFSRELTCKKLQEKYGLSADAAEAYMEKYWN